MSAISLHIKNVHAIASALALPTLLEWWRPQAIAVPVCKKIASSITFQLEVSGGHRDDGCVSLARHMLMRLLSHSLGTSYVDGYRWRPWASSALALPTKGRIHIFFSDLFDFVETSGIGR